MPNMAYQVRFQPPFRAEAQTPLGSVSAAEIQKILQTAPKVILTVQPYLAKVAAIAPSAVPILKQLLPILAYGPKLAPLAAIISKDVSTVLQNAPSYTNTLTEVMNTLAKAPELAAQIAAVSGQMATISQQIGEDPALGPFIERMQTIIRLYQARKGLNGLGGNFGATTPGIGLKWFIPWMDRGIFVLEHPTLIYAVPAAAVAAVLLIGFGLGRLTSSK